VLEAAHVLSQHQFNATIIFIAFDREEQGLVGSNAYVDHHLGLNFLGMISLDMIAHNAPAGAPGHNQAAIWGAAASLPIRGDLAAAVTRYSGGLTPVDRGSLLDCCSDQRAFENHGFQGALLIENSHNDYYHTTSDSLDNPGYIDYTFATGMTRAAVGYLAEKADETPEPATAFSILLAGAILFAARRRIHCR
jgi:Zn-dependent M28 family amino/carboxypeptidase